MGEETAKEITLRELLVESRNISRKVKQITAEIYSLEQGEASEEVKNPVSSGLRAELYEIRDNLKDAANNLSRIYAQLREEKPIPQPSS